MNANEVDIPIDVPAAPAKSAAVAPAVPMPAPVTGVAEAQNASTFDPHSTLMFQSKMKKAPVWFCSFLAGNSREKKRLSDELTQMKGALPLLLKQRRGGTWTPEDKLRLKDMLRSASSVSPYLFIWALPGSMLLLPFLAWYIDTRRKIRARRLGN